MTDGAYCVVLDADGSCFIFKVILFCMEVLLGGVLGCAGWRRRLKRIQQWRRIVTAAGTAAVRCRRVCRSRLALGCSRFVAVYGWPMFADAPRWFAVGPWQLELCRRDGWRRPDLSLEACESCVASRLVAAMWAARCEAV